MKKSLVMIFTIIFVFGFSYSAMAADNAFADVPAKHWAYDSIAKLAKAGIIEGYDNKTFHGERLLTRYEMAAIVANAMTKEDKADAAAKAEIGKLQAEFSNELQQLGIRVTAVEKKVNDIGNVKFNFWGRVLMNTYNNSLANDNLDTQIRYKLKMKSQLEDNVWVYAVLGSDQGYNTASSSNWTGTTTGGVNLQKMFTKVKTGNWYFNFGRQSSNEASGPGMLGGGMFMACSTGFDGLSTYYVDPKNRNNTFDIGYFNRAYGGAVRHVTVSSATYELFPNVTLLGAYFKDGGQKDVSSSTLADQASIGIDAKFGNDKQWRILAEYGRNNAAKQAAAYEAKTGASLYNGKNTGWDVLFQYGQSDINKKGSWDISFDLRRFQPGFQPYSGTEWAGGVYNPSALGITSNIDNAKGVGVYYSYVPFKNIRTQLSWLYLAPVVKAAGGDGKYRQGLVLYFDFMY